MPLFITLGSPLGIEIVKKRLPARSAFPRPPVTRWINAVCKDDFVTLNRQLDKATLGYEGVELERGVTNNQDDKHAIAPYLKCRTVAKAIWSALPGQDRIVSLRVDTAHAMALNRAADASVDGTFSGSKSWRSQSVVSSRTVGGDGRCRYSCC